MKENIEIQATSFERIRPYRMNEASENGEVSADIIHYTMTPLQVATTKPHSLRFCEVQCSQSPVR